VKEIIGKLNKQFESRVRLGIMSVLMVNESVDFNTLKELLDVTDGNLASHLSALEKYELIEVRKQFIGRKPNTRYQITETGRSAFKEHLDHLAKLINKQTLKYN
jgi:DNA-binding HxlR family transcriptional regulator